MEMYRRTYRASLDDPETFWLSAAQEIDWVEPPRRALDASGAPLYRWFSDGTLNTCYNALDRHVVAGHGDRAALIHDSPVAGSCRTLSYRELRDQVARFAGALTELGVERGDRVVISMPMVPEAVVAMLACARIGAVHSVVFGGFAAPELAARLDDALPKVIVVASCGLEGSRVVPYKPLLEKALELASCPPPSCVVFQRPQLVADIGPHDVEWAELMARAKPVDCTAMTATDPLYILYTSGTTGKPKGVVRDHGGHAVALQWSMANIYGAHAGDVFWAASDIGWVVGHSYIVYAPLIAGCTTVMYEGKPVGTPDAGAFWRVIADHRVQTLFTAPTAIRAIRKEDPTGSGVLRYDVTSLKNLFLAGERLDPNTYRWVVQLLEVPIVDHWWQTETGWPIVANLQGLDPMPTKAGSPSVPVPGWALQVLDHDGRSLTAGQEGAIVLRLPLPPGSLLTLWNDDERYVESYLSRHPGYYLTGDGGYIDEDGYVYVMGRIDDVINVAGHRLSTGEIEEALSSHPDVAESAVIGVPDELKGQLPRGLVVLKSGVDRDPAELRAELVALVREQVGPVAALRDVDVVPALPKTRSGKVLRKTLRDMASGREGSAPSTIEDPSVLDGLREVVRPA